jgi:hypothetical protein
MLGSYKQIALTLAILPVAASFSSIDTNSRRDFLKSIAFTSAAVTSAPIIANASYGDSSKIILPNYIEFLIEKNRQVDPSA